MPARKQAKLALAKERQLKATNDELAVELSFWHWAIRERGFGHFFHGIWYHVVIGAALAWALPGKLSAMAMAVMLPLAAILIGFAVSWSATATTLIQTDELRSVGSVKDGLFTADRYWVFWYQSVVWVVLATTTVWALIAAGIADNWLIGELCPWWLRLIGRTLLLTLSSLSVRESWQVTIAAQQKQLAYLRLKREQREEVGDRGKN